MASPMISRIFLIGGGTMNEIERRKHWSRIVGVERRGAPVPTLEGHALPNPSLLLDEECHGQENESPPNRNATSSNANNPGNGS